MNRRASCDPVSAAVLVVERVRLLLDAAAGENVAGDLASVTKRLNGPEGEPRRHLAKLFKLAPEEIDVLDAAIAVAVEPALGPRIADLQGMPGRLLPTTVALRRLFGHGPQPVPRTGSSLLTWYLAALHYRNPGEPPMIEVDPAVVEWYFAQPSIAGIDGLSVTRARDFQPLPEWDMATSTTQIGAALGKGTPVRVCIAGLPGSGRADLAAALARALNRRPLSIDLVGGQSPTIASVVRIQRLAMMSNSLTPIWRTDPGNWPPQAMLAPLQFVLLECDAEPRRIEGLVDLVLPMPVLAPASRDTLAKRLLPVAVTKSLSPLGAPRIADLVDAAALGISEAGAFHTMLRQRTRERIQGVGRIVDTHFDWDDLILPEPVKQLLRAIEREARSRNDLLSAPEARRLFEGSAALTALFSGSPGTGKSMAGQILAGALKLDLLVIDTSAISSKFIGDTAKNMTRAFAVAREANCAIMFDEADSWFSRRVENDSVNARHANADTGHLLQLIEAHRHLVMLSTNRRGAIDQAFVRRLRFIIDFPLPQAAERLMLWTRMLAALGLNKNIVAGLAGQLAEPHALSAAQIKSASLTAGFLARERKDKKITLELLRAGIARELAKEGKIGEIVMAPMAWRRVHERS